MAITRNDLTVKPLTDNDWKGEVELITAPNGKHYVLSQETFPPFEETLREHAENHPLVILGLSSVDEVLSELREVEDEYRAQYNEIVRGRDGETAVFETDEKGYPVFGEDGDLIQIVAVDGLDREKALDGFLAAVNA